MQKGLPVSARALRTASFVSALVSGRRTTGGQAHRNKNKEADPHAALCMRSRRGGGEEVGDAGEAGRGSDWRAAASAQGGLSQMKSTFLMNVLSLHHWKKSALTWTTSSKPSDARCWAQTPS